MYKMCSIEPGTQWAIDISLRLIPAYIKLYSGKFKTMQRAHTHAYACAHHSNSMRESRKSLHLFPSLLALTSSGLSEYKPSPDVVWSFHPLKWSEWAVHQWFGDCGRQL